MDSGIQIENQKLKKCNCMYICLQNTFASCTHLLILCLTLKYNLIGKINTLLGYRKNTFYTMGSQICLPNIFLMEMYAEIKTLKYFFRCKRKRATCFHCRGAYNT